MAWPSVLRMSMSTQLSGPPASGPQFSICWILSPDPNQDQDTMHALLDSVYLSIQHVAVLVPFLCSLLGPSRLSRERPFVPQIGLHFPPSCPLSTVDTLVYLFQHLCIGPAHFPGPQKMADGPQLKPGHLLSLLPGHNSPRRIRLSSEDSPVGERRGRSLAWA